MTIWKKTADPYIKKRHGGYWARFTKNGKRVEQSLETKNFEVAKAAVAEMQAKILLGKSWKKERQLFADAWLDFLIDKKEGNKVRPAREKTLYEYASFGTRYFIPFFGDMRVSDIEDEWENFIVWVKDNFGEIEFFNISKYMSGFVTWAIAHEKFTARPYLRDPDQRKKLEKEEYSPGKAYTLEELRVMRTASAKHERFHLFMLMLQYQGMRPGEVTQLKKERINLVDNVIELKKADTKTNSGRIVPIHPLVRKALLKRLEAKGTSDYLFPHAHIHAKPNAPMDRTGFKRMWSTVLAGTGLEGRIYDFRHTFITHAIKQGVNAAAVAKLTGTSLRIIEKHYLHLSPTDLNSELMKFEL